MPPHVAVAEYLYRHEAEFAAGFLRDAGIPFRLQIDDAGGADAGVTIARPAVLWVRAEDAEEARDLLDIPGEEAGPLSEGEWAEASTLDDRGRERDAGADRSRGVRPEGRPTDLDRRDPRPGASPWDRAPLCGAERAVAGLLALALFGLAAGGGPRAVPWVGVWEGLALAVALVLGLAAVSGETFESVRTILRALSGRLS